ncbi:MAG TPA: aspartate dehydrogenase [Methanosarcinales archaeon]|nr:aspartate dehydrogenase [Methanosarcinales archaeon]
MLRIGVVGCGAIGTEICKATDHKTVKAQLVAIYDRNHDKAINLAKSLKKTPQILDIQEMVKQIDLIVECASQEAVPLVAIPALLNKKDVVILSVGALVDSELLNKITKLARENNCKVYLPSGAIAGLDGIKSASIAKIDTVTLVTSKPPSGLKGAPYIIEKKIDLDLLKKASVIFEGSAEKAAKYFPANVNVAVALSLASLGVKKTKVKIIANPALTKNMHKIVVQGEFGKIETRVENVPSPTNPKTSYLAALSAIATLKKIAEPIQIGT